MDDAKIAPVPTARNPFEGRPPTPEVVLPDLDSTVRWHEHGFPHPLARWHTHPEVEVHLIRESSGHAFIGDHVGRFGPGHLALVGSGLPHNWLSELEPGERVERRDVVLQIDPRRIAALAEIAPEAGEALRLFRSAERGIEYSGATAVRAAAELERIGPARGLERLSRVLRLLDVLARAPQDEHRVLSRAVDAAALDAKAQQRVDAVLRYLTERLEEGVRLEDAARIAGMTPLAFSRFFARAAGRGFAETVRRLRIMRACRLLDDGDRRVADICYASGYQNLSNFNRQFRAETGMTPREYRRRARSADPEGSAGGAG